MNLVLLVVGLIGGVAITGLVWFVTVKRETRLPRVTGHLVELRSFLAITEFFCQRAYTLHSELYLVPSNLIREPFSELEYESMRKSFYKMVADSMGPELIKLATFYFGDIRCFFRFVSSFYEVKLVSSRTIGPSSILGDMLTNGKSMEDTLSGEFLKHLRKADKNENETGR